MTLFVLAIDLVVRPARAGSLTVWILFIYQSQRWTRQRDRRNQIVIGRERFPGKLLLAIGRARRLRSARTGRYFVRDVTVASRAADSWCGYAWAVYR
jgi:hypothetical protein